VRRAPAAARYLGADVLRSQRFLIPMVVYAAVLAILFGGDPGPPPTPWGASAIVLYPVAAWLALVVANTDDPVQRTVTTVAAGGHAAVAAATLLVALAGDALLVAMAVGVPALRGPYGYPPSTLLLGTLAHIACAAAGTAVGLLCARPLVQRVGWSFCLGGTVVVVTVVQPWLPPVGTAVKALTGGGPDPLVSAGLGLALAVGAAAVCWLVERRR
jgi:hypothetical protein